MMIDDELKRMEESDNAKRLRVMLAQAGDEENQSMNPLPCKPYKKVATKRPLVSPYWLAAALVVGFLAGMSVRGNHVQERNDNQASLLADTSYMYGRSLADNDVNRSLLVMMR